MRAQKLPPLGVSPGLPRAGRAPSPARPTCPVPGLKRAGYRLALGRHLAAGSSALRASPLLVSNFSRSNVRPLLALKEFLSLVFVWFWHVLGVIQNKRMDAERKALRVPQPVVSCLEVMYGLLRGVL